MISRVLELLFSKKQHHASKNQSPVGIPDRTNSYSLMFLTKHSDPECIKKAAEDNRLSYQELLDRLNETSYLEVFVRD